MQTGLSNNLLYDCHMHFGVMLSALFGDKTPFCQNLAGIMDALHSSFIDRGIVFPFPNDFIGNDVLPDIQANKFIREIFEAVPYLSQNKRLLLEVAETSDGSVLPVMMFSLKYGIDEQLQFLYESSERRRIYGLKYYADADGIPLSKFCELGKPFIEFLINTGLPIVFHTSASTVVSGSGLSFPDDILGIADNYPQLRICIAHMAHFSKSVFSRLQTEAYPNVFLDTSPFLHLCNIREVNQSEYCMPYPYEQPNEVLKAVIDLFPTRILWGSDFPFNFTCNLSSSKHDKDYSKYSFANNMTLIESLSNCDINRIAHNNPERFLFGTGGE